MIASYSDANSSFRNPQELVTRQRQTWLYGPDETVEWHHLVEVMSMVKIFFALTAAWGYHVSTTTPTPPPTEDEMMKDIRLSERILRSLTHHFTLVSIRPGHSLCAK